MKIKEIKLSPEEIDYLLKGNIHWDDLQDKTEKQVRKPLEPNPSQEVLTNSFSPAPNIKKGFSSEVQHSPEQELSYSKDKMSVEQLSSSENLGSNEKVSRDINSKTSEESVVQEFFPDWKPLPLKKSGKDGEKAQVLRGKSDPNEWARRLKRLEEMEKQRIEQPKEELIKEDLIKEENRGAEQEELREEGYLGNEDTEETWPEEKTVFAGSKVYVLLSMMGCITLGTWLYFVFSH